MGRNDFMSIFVLLLSMIFALIEAGLSYVVLAYEPVSSIFADVPAFLLTGGIFAVGMLLTFLLIIIIGSMNIPCRAGDFVRNYFGKTVALALISTLLVGSVSLGAEALYQIRPAPETYDKPGFVRSVENPEILDTLLTPRESYVYTPVTSDIEKNVQSAGGNVDAPLRFSIQWSESTYAPDNNDLDAHSISGSETIYFSNKVGAYSKGELDVDIVRPEEENVEVAVENIMFSDLDAIKGRTFKFLVDVYAYRSGASGFRAEIELGDDIYSYEYTGAMANKNQIKVADVSVDQDGNMTIVHHLNYTSLFDPAETASETSVTEVTQNFIAKINRSVMRCVLIAIIAFLFKLISSICIGKNDHSFLMYIVVAFIISIIASLVLEFGSVIGLPLWIVLGIFWLLLSTLVVSA